MTDFDRVAARYEAARDCHARARGDYRRETHVALAEVSLELWWAIREGGESTRISGTKEQADTGRFRDSGGFRYVSGNEPGDLWRLKVEPRRPRNHMVGFCAPRKSLAEKERSA